MTLLDALLLDSHPFNVWIAKRTDGVKGTGTASDPYDGSTAAKFDAVMAGLGANTRLHLGSGTFETNGYSYGISGGWQVKPGMKIEGAGVGVTTLKLVNHTVGDYYYAIGHDVTSGTKVDFCEVSDLTIDCNLPAAGVSTACGAVQLMGEHVKIFRVKAINWGSKDGLKSVAILSCFTALPNYNVTEIAHAGIEDCIVVSPGAGNIGFCTALVCGSLGFTFSNEQHGKASYIRHCFVDCGVVTPDPSPATAKYRGICMSWCRGGVVEGNQVHNADIGGPYVQYKQNTRDVIVRNNYFRNVGRGPYWDQGDFGPEMGPGSLVRSGTVGTVSGLTVTPFEVGTRVKLVTSPATYNGVYIVQSQTSTSFTITVPNSGTTLVSVTSARKLFGVNRAIVEGNSIELPVGVSGVCGIGLADNNDSSPYSELPDYVHEQIIVRNNKIRYVDGQPPSDSTAKLIELKGARNAMVQNNVLDTVSTAPLVDQRAPA